MALRHLRLVIFAVTVPVWMWTSSRFLDQRRLMSWIDAMLRLAAQEGLFVTIFSSFVVWALDKRYVMCPEAHVESMCFIFRSLALFQPLVCSIILCSMLCVRSIYLSMTLSSYCIIPFLVVILWWSANAFHWICKLLLTLVIFRFRYVFANARQRVDVI